MTLEQQKDLARETYELFLQVLGKKNPDIEIVKPPSDPALIPKDNCKDVMRIRVLPKKKLPTGFWGVSGCFYEIGVGRYAPLLGDSSSLCLGGVQFFQYPQQERYGGGQYETDVKVILKKLLAIAPKGFSLRAPETDGKFHFQKRYVASEHKGVLFPCNQAAEDLAWLVSESIPQFWAIPNRE